MVPQLLRGSSRRPSFDTAWTLRRHREQWATLPDFFTSAVAIAPRWLRPAMIDVGHTTGICKRTAPPERGLSRSGYLRYSTAVGAFQRRLRAKWYCMDLIIIVQDCPNGAFVFDGGELLIGADEHFKRFITLCHIVVDQQNAHNRT